MLVLDNLAPYLNLVSAIIRTCFTEFDKLPLAKLLFDNLNLNAVVPQLN